MKLVFSAIGLLNQWFFALCRYLWEEGWCSIEKGGWEESEKESKNHRDMARIKCEGSEERKKERKKQCEGARLLVYNFNKLRKSGRTCYFGQQPKLDVPWTIENNFIDLRDEGED